MANLLKMADIHAILQLHALRWPQRRIARELGIHRGTVAKVIRKAQTDSIPAKVPTGSEESKPATFDPSPGPQAKPAKVPTGAPAGRGGDQAPQPPSAADTADSMTVTRNRCEPYRQQILPLVEQGLSAQRIWQDLVSEGAALKYDSVRRFVAKLTALRELPFRRLECGPGEEAQVDFGTGAPLIGPDGKRQRTHVFRVVLSHSRKGYSEVTRQQTTEDFFRALENAFWHFGGVPKTLVIDNLKAAVAHPDWFDPELTPKVQSFCQHYGTVILPTKPRTPRHKGKIEAGVKYVQNNALKGRTFLNLEEQNRFLLEWESNVADTRIHGTTKRQVLKVFQELERAALLALPCLRFACFHEARRKVNRDGHVQVAKAYYSVPPEYLGREVWARWDARLVRIFNHRWEQVAIHVRSEPGRFNTNGLHVPEEKISGLERGAAYLLSRVASIGPKAKQWAEATLTARGIQGTRVLQGLLALTKKHDSETLEKACETALSYGCFQLRPLRKLLDGRAAAQQPLPFLEEHPLIRPLDDYAAVVRRAIHRQDSRSSMSEGFERHERGDVDVAAAQQKSLAPPSSATPGSTQSSVDLRPPGSGYPSSGCSSAAPDSVSPANSSVLHDSFSQPQDSHHE
jgi:transposase